MIESTVTILILVDGFLQFVDDLTDVTFEGSHNPYFSRWFSAMNKMYRPNKSNRPVTILILVDGFLQ